MKCAEKSLDVGLDRLAQKRFRGGGLIRIQRLQTFGQKVLLGGEQEDRCEGARQRHIFLF